MQICFLRMPTYRQNSEEGFEQVINEKKQEKTGWLPQSEKTWQRRLYRR